MPVKTMFSSSGADTRVIKIDSENLKDNLTPAVYTVQFSDMAGYYLTYHLEKFSEPSHIYGSSASKIEKIVNTFQLRDKSTGVLLTGDKGSGKSLISNLSANKAIALGYPVIVINESYTGANFNEFIESIGDCVLFFDEFGKVYSDEDDQESLLTLLDGTTSAKRLVLMTENKERLISEFIIGRTGRVFYHFRFDKLEKSVIKEYCKALAVSEEVQGQIEEVYYGCFDFSFDILKAIVDEYLRYGGDIKDIVQDMNITSIYHSVNVEKFIPFALEREGETLEVTNKSPEPLMHHGDVRVDYKDSENEEDYERFSMSDIKEMSSEFLQLEKNGLTLKLKRVVDPSKTHLF